MKKAIIIGATSGIGKELTRLLVENKYMVGITGRRAEILKEIKSEKPDSIMIRSFDISQPEESITCLEELLAELGGLDLLIISSGTGEINMDLDFSLERKTIETNVLGFTNIADWAFNYFEKKGHGHLVGISSVGGLRGGRGAPSYNASKAYQMNYLEALRQKAAFLEKPIIVTDIRPGFVDTPMAKGEGLFWVASVEKAGNQILRAILKKRKVAYVTARWKLIAFSLKIMPRALYDKL